MTVIAAISEGGKVYMGGDSAGVGGFSLTVRKDPKVFKTGEFVIGYTSSFRMGQILRFYLSPPAPTEGQDPFAYMVTVFIPAVRECLKSHGYARTENSQESIGQFLVGWRGAIYDVQPDLQVSVSSHPYDACGCGVDLALGSLFTSTGAPEDRLRKALEAAQEFSAGVRGPFVVEVA